MSLNTFTPILGTMRYNELLVKNVFIADFYGLFTYAGSIFSIFTAVVCGEKINNICLILWIWTYLVVLSYLPLGGLLFLSHITWNSIIIGLFL